MSTSQTARLLLELSEQSLAQLEIAKEFNKLVKRLNKAAVVDGKNTNEISDINSDLEESIRRLIDSAGKASKTVIREAKLTR